MADYRASLRLDFGSLASFDAIASAVHDLHIVIDFAQELQSVLDRNDAAYSVLRRRDLGPIFDDFDLAPGFVRSEFLASLISSGSSFLRSAAFERAVQQRLAELALDRIVRVQNLQYLNPLDINISFSGEGIAKVLGVIRDWGPNRREAEARAREADADARAADARANSYEEDLRFKQDVHNAVRGALADGDLRIGRDDIDRLATKEVERALGSLLDRGVEAEVELDLDDDVAQ